jgi:hypothetical protein
MDDTAETVPVQSPPPEKKGVAHMKNLLASALVTAAVVAFVSGCASTSYYKVTDPATNKVYYTQELDPSRTGAVAFKDGATGNEVRMQKPELMKIYKSTFKDNTPDL